MTQKSSLHISAIFLDTWAATDKSSSFWKPGVKFLPCWYYKLSSNVLNVLQNWLWRWLLHADLRFFTTLKYLTLKYCLHVSAIFSYIWAATVKNFIFLKAWDHFLGMLKWQLFSKCLKSTSKLVLNIHIKLVKLCVFAILCFDFVSAVSSWIKTAGIFK